MEQTQLTVTDVVSRVKNVLEGQFRNITLVGEVSNLSHSSTGHWYFTLSDAQSSMSGALFKMDAFRNPAIKKMKDGDKVMVTGSIGVYTKRGTFQLIAKRITPVGKGDLKEQFEQLKRRLAADGLFDMEAKQPIPKLPRRLAVITAPGAAALQDFLNILNRRSQWMDVVLVPALVQGDAAPASIRKALHNTIKYSLEMEKTDPSKCFDVIVLTRGGGSLEDLWAFNDEALAWDIHNCPIPIISAVGHQVDFSISDFVADLRCETPSAAAEVLSHEQTKLLESMSNSKRHLLNFQKILISENAKRLQRSHPRVILDKIWGQYNNYQRRLERCNISYRLDELTQLPEYNMRLDDAIDRIQEVINERVGDYKMRADKASELLRVLNPSNVLGRGYSYATDEDGHVISDIKGFGKLASNSRIRLNFHDGDGTVIKE